jgi:hypothetical protein
VTAPFGSAGTAGRNYRVQLPAHSWHPANQEYGLRNTCSICGQERQTHGRMQKSSPKPRTVDRNPSTHFVGPGSRTPDSECAGPLGGDS